MKTNISRSEDNNSDNSTKLSVSANNWFVLAEQALAMLEGVPQKQRGAVLAKLSALHEIHPTHIRRAAKAAAFLRTLRGEDLSLAKALQTQSYQAVEVLERWHRRDPRGARRAARRLLNGDYSIASLTKDQQSRTQLEIDLDDDKDQALTEAFAELARRNAIAAIGGEMRPLSERPAALGLGSLVDYLVVDRSDVVWAVFALRRPPTLAEMAMEDVALSGDILKCQALGYRALVIHESGRDMSGLTDILGSLQVSEGSYRLLALDFQARLKSIKLDLEF